MIPVLRPVAAAASIDDLFSRPDAEFIACAYVTLLRRPADAEGFLHYLSRLRHERDKFAVIHALCTSEEGLLLKPSLPGLTRALIRHRIKRLPVLRRVLALRRSFRGSRSAALPAPAPVAGIDAQDNTPSLDAFDPVWYVTTYPAVAAIGLDPHEHYLKFGQAAGLLPSAAAAHSLLIDGPRYLRAYPDVAASGLDPWQHYVNKGRGEGRVTGISLSVLQFDSDWYLRRNPDVASEGIDPFHHFTTDGIRHGREGSSFRGLDSITAEPLLYSDPLPAPEVKVVAFYLPQFHPIPENDRWWGKGFTEWTNVSRGRPFYAEHDQPRLPGELGFYDLRITDHMKRQAELASSHGVHGFCFYYYWFGGKRLLEKPVEQFLADPDIDINFCFCWANENWTRRWDGLEQDVLMAQRHSPEDDLAFIAEIAKAFGDPRYIRVEGKPLLVIYRPELLPDTRATVSRWRQWCRDNGIGEIHLCYTRAFGSAPLSQTGMDATIEFPPATSTIQEITPCVPDRDPAFAGQIHSYLVAAKAAQRYVRGVDLEYRGVMPSWDNTARKMERGISFYGATPELYGEWLGHAVEETRRNLQGDHRLVFINAWNEWGEGAYMEPDRRMGYALLNRTREVLAALAQPVVNDADLRARAHRNASIAIVVHLHYGDLFESIAKHLDNVPEPADLYFSVRDGSFLHMRQIIHDRFPQATVVSYPNRGRDVLPFLRILAHIREFGYDAICKIHSKKSRHRGDGDQWRDDVLSKLLGKQQQIAALLDRIRNGTGLIAPEGHLLPGSTYWGSNARRVTELATLMKCPAAWIEDFRFPAGTMFWCRPDALLPLLALGLRPEDFEDEAGQVDGTTAHAVERLIGLSARFTGTAISTTTDASTEDMVPYTFALPTTMDGAQVARDSQVGHGH